MHLLMRQSTLLFFVAVLAVVQSSSPSLSLPAPVAPGYDLPLSWLLSRLRGGNRLNVSVESRQGESASIAGESCSQLSYKSALLSSIARSPTEAAVVASRSDRDSAKRNQKGETLSAAEDPAMDISDITSVMEESRTEPTHLSAPDTKPMKSRPLLPSKLVSRKKPAAKKKEGRADMLLNGLTLRKGDKLSADRLSVAAKLGTGGFGAVYGVHDHHVGRHIALKVQRPGKKSSQIALDEVAFLRRCNEERRLERMEESEGAQRGGGSQVVEMYGSFFVNGTCGSQVCIELELLGPSLLDLIRDTKYRGVPVETAKRIAKRLLHGLAFLHDRCGLIHTDVKPENVLLDLEWRSDDPGPVGWWGEAAGWRGGRAEPGAERAGGESRWRLQAGWSAELVKEEEAEATEGVEAGAEEDTALAAGAGEGQGGSRKQGGGRGVERREGGQHEKRRREEGGGAGRAALPRLGAKVVDLGNACAIGKPFTDDIQTIEYRSPEVLVGAGYDAAADVWSVACTVFELLTGEYLFDCRLPSGPGRVPYTREESLLALQQELLGDLPAALRRRGKLSDRYFAQSGRLRHISKLRRWALPDVLAHKYCMPPALAAEISTFLLPMLELEPSRRASAASMLAHPWLAAVD